MEQKEPDYWETLDKIYTECDIFQGIQFIMLSDLLFVPPPSFVYLTLFLEGDYD